MGFSVEGYAKKSCVNTSDWCYKSLFGS